MVNKPKKFYPYWRESGKKVDTTSMSYEELEPLRRDISAAMNVLWTLYPGLRDSDVLRAKSDEEMLGMIRHAKQIIKNFARIYEKGTESEKKELNLILTTLAQEGYVVGEAFEGLCTLERDIGGKSLRTFRNKILVEIRRKKMYRLSIKVIDDETNKSIPGANVEITGTIKKVLLADINGICKIEHYSPFRGVMRVSAVGYSEEIKGFDANREYQEITVKLRRIKKNEVQHLMRPPVRPIKPNLTRTAYQYGPLPGKRWLRGAGGAASQIFNVPLTKWKENMPANVTLQMAISKGKRLLNRYARAEYRRIFRDIKKHRLEPMRDALKRAKKDYIKTRRKIRLKVLEKKVKLSFNPAELLNEINDLINSRTLNATEQRAMEDARDKMVEYFDKEKEYAETVKSATEDLHNTLKNYLEEKAKDISLRIAREYQFPVNSPMEKKLEEVLLTHAKFLTEDYVTRGRTLAKELVRQIALLSESTMTMYAFWENFIHNLLALFGPWILALIFIAAQLFLLFVYSPSNAVPGLIVGGLAGLFVFVMNFASTNYPLDFINNFFEGVVIGLNCVLIIVSLGWSLGSLIGIIAWIVLGTIGVFQVYAHGGFRLVAQFTILILLASYLLIGPYSGITKNYIRKAKDPLETAWFVAKEGVENVWLIATNPSKWYALQQQKNVNPDKPTIVPKGVEIRQMEAMPKSVPQHFEFAISGIIENRGEQTAKLVEVSLTCRENEDPNSDAHCEFINPPAPLVFDKIIPGSSHIISFSGIKAMSPPRTFLHPVLRVKYFYSTSSNLLVTVMTQEEIERQQKEGKEVFHNVVAKGIPGPVMLSLNVGPQPLVAYSPSVLLIAILNQRNDGKVVFPEGTKIYLSQRDVAMDGKFTCRIPENYMSVGSEDNKVVFTITKQIEIRPKNRNEVFSFICSFTAKSPIPEGSPETMGAKTGIITVSVDGYQFEIEKEIDVYVTEPLGIISPGTGTQYGCAQYCAGITGKNSDLNLVKLINDASGVDECGSVSELTPDLPLIIGAIIQKESDCKHYTSDGSVICGGSEEIGMMQLLPSTATSVLGSAEKACDPAENIKGGAKYFCQLYQSVDNYIASIGAVPPLKEEKIKLAFAAYNSGLGNIKKAIKNTKDAGKTIVWANVKNHLVTSAKNQKITKTYVDNAFSYYKGSNCYKK